MTPEIGAIAAVAETITEADLQTLPQPVQRLAVALVVLAALLLIGYRRRQSQRPADPLSWHGPSGVGQAVQAGCTGVSARGSR